MVLIKARTARRECAHRHSADTRKHRRDRLRQLQDIGYRVIQQATNYAVHCGRRVVQARDVSHALADEGIAICTDTPTTTNVGGKNVMRCAVSHKQVALTAVGARSSQKESTRPRQMGGAPGQSATLTCGGEGEFTMGQCFQPLVNETS